MKTKEIIMTVCTVIFLLISYIITSFLGLHDILYELSVDKPVIGYILSLTLVIFILSVMKFLQKKMNKSKEHNKLNLTKSEKSRFLSGIAVIVLVAFFVTGNPPISYLYTRNNTLGFVVRTIIFGTVIGFIQWYRNKILKDREAKQ